MMSSALNHRLMDAALAGGPATDAIAAKRMPWLSAYHRRMLFEELCYSKERFVGAFLFSYHMRLGLYAGIAAQAEQGLVYSDEAPVTIAVPRTLGVRPQPPAQPLAPGPA